MGRMTTQHIKRRKQRRTLSYLDRQLSAGTARKGNTGSSKIHSFAGLPKENLFGTKKRLQKSQLALGLLIEN